MAKRRKFNPFKRRTRTIRVKGSRRRSSVSSSVSPLKRFLYGAGYGFGRAQASSFVNQKIAPYLPFGQYADEVVFAGLSYFMAKSGNKTLKRLGESGLTVEGALAGSQAGQSLNLFGSTSAPAQATTQMTSFK